MEPKTEGVDQRTKDIKDTQMKEKEEKRRKKKKNNFCK